MAKLTIKQIANMSQYELSKMSKKELRSAYSQLRSAVKKRQATFKKHNAEYAVPKTVREAKAPSKMNMKELRSAISAAGNFYLSDKGTYTKWKKKQKERKKKLEDNLGIPLTDDQMDSFGEFMSEARYRSGDNYVSAQAAELYAAATEKNMDPDQFLRNYDYWTQEKNLEALKQADEITRSRKVYPSDYIKKLGLQPIKSYVSDKYK